MSDFAIGQRWISETEIELGLGLITGISGRQVSLLFPASGENRAYASSEAPLTRYLLEIDDVSRHSDGWSFRVTDIEETEGVLIYHGQADDGAVKVPETQLHYQVQLNSPVNRLLAGQIDRVSKYNLRQETHQYLQKWLKHPARGLLGARIELLPHQLYIGHNVGSRPAPRVLLADEVGLGKTIEAGLIMQTQLINGMANRILIQVPDSLLHQWMIELRRRFSLYFSILDNDYCELYDEQEENPFEQAQLVLCPSSLLHEPQRAAQAATAGWDLVVIDEAHQLDTQDIQNIREIAANKGLLLLTATPDQAGADSHFAQLQLLDPERFHDLQQFREEQKKYRAIADQAATMDSDSPEINQLLDEHGTGRVLMRNTRAHIKGFPQRRYQPHELSPDEAEIDIFDSKIEWLQKLAKSVQPEKILVITHNQQQVEEAAAFMRVRFGRHCALFHEGMTLVERDRAAAFFADQEDGAQLLISSEIGGEGRNFQFARHIVMLDLPTHPDRLEQRIGRLDRIGQSDHIDIHVPYANGSRDQRLALWYEQGMQAFTQPNATGHRLMQLLGGQLETKLTASDSEFAEFVENTRQHYEDVKASMAEGRDRLLELNSCRPELANKLQQAIAATDGESSLPTFMFAFWDQFGVEVEDKDGKRLILKPGQHFAANGLPGLDEEGSLVTFDRVTALAYDDVQFLTWEHPQVQTAFELVLNESQGTSSVAILKNSALPTGHWFLELIFSASIPEAPTLGLQQLYPTAPVRLFLDSSGRNMDSKITAQTLNKQLHFVNKKSGAQMVKALRKPCQQLVKDSWPEAENKLNQACAVAGTDICNQLEDEIRRMRTLRERNPSIREDEIQALEQKKENLEKAFAKPQLNIDSVRLVVNAGADGATV
ncbi:RNA polymerase-associated protein RapA [Aliidiomarina minuta]|uniref:RNA polymerase-associated protein RapA n=1 Tax=Aliidiomarina minuta TaxID=880057 RepID=A0A432W4C8_9GAMM|nr:SNF2-related protein [Aliidiomarina minuta]RUO24310.1 RNA polymerase-associated protein RapA [Aliidiomarina minuta]